MGLSSKISGALTYNAFRMVLSTLNSILYSIIVVRWLQIQKFGGYAFLDSIFSILAVIYVLGTHAPIIRFVPELIAKEDYCKLRTLVSSLQIINFIASSTTMLLLFLGLDIFLTALGKTELSFYARLMALAIVPKAVLGITKNILNALYEQKFLGLFETFFSFLELSLLIWFTVGLNLELTGVIIVPLISNTLAAILYSIYVRKKYPHVFKGGRCPIGREYVRRVIRYTAPLTALDLISNFVSYAGNTFLGILRNLEEVAYFDIPNSFVERVFQQIWLVIGYVGVVSLTEASYSDRSKLTLAVQQYVKIISLYAIPVAMGGVILAEPLLVTFYGEKVLPSVEIFRILLPMYCMLNILRINVTVLNVKEKTHLILLGEVSRSILITILSFWLIPSLGINGTLISKIVPSFIITAYYMYIVTSRLKMANIIPIRAVAKYLTASLFMGAIIMILMYFLQFEPLPLLAVSLTLGPLSYVLALRLIGAFDQTDKRLLIESKIPFKRAILRLLWKS